MKSYTIVFDEKLISQLKKLAKRDTNLYGAVKKKILQVAENPYLGKPLHRPLQGLRRVHVRHFVLIFRIHEKDRRVIFLSFSHHDDAYTR